MKAPTVTKNASDRSMAFTMNSWCSPWASKVWKLIFKTHGVRHRVMAFAMNLERAKIIFLTPFAFKTPSSQLSPTPNHSFTIPTYNYYLFFPKPSNSKTFPLLNSTPPVLHKSKLILNLHIFYFHYSYSQTYLLKHQFLFLKLSIMAQGGNADFNGITFRDRRDSEKQRRRYEALLNWEIVPARYAHDPCLCTLGLYDSVHWLLKRLGLSHFLHEKTPLMLESH